MEEKRGSGRSSTGQSLLSPVLGIFFPPRSKKKGASGRNPKSLFVRLPLVTLTQRTIQVEKSLLVLPNVVLVRWSLQGQHLGGQLQERSKAVPMAGSWHHMLTARW